MKNIEVSNETWALINELRRKHSLKTNNQVIEALLFSRNKEEQKEPVVEPAKVEPQVVDPNIGIEHTSFPEVKRDEPITFEELKKMEGKKVIVDSSQENCPHTEGKLISVGTGCIYVDNGKQLLRFDIKLLTRVKKVVLE